MAKSDVTINHLPRTRARRWSRWSRRGWGGYTANEKHRYGLRYEFISDLISEKVSHLTFPPNSDIRSDMNPIGPHIGMVFHHDHCPYRRDIGNAPSKLDRRSEKQRKKRVGPNNFYVKRLSDIRSDMNSYRTSYRKAFSRALPIWDLWFIYRTSYRKYYIVFITVYLYLKLCLTNTYLLKQISHKADHI
jgi:hypothetical protein